jgi:predicted ArsR family transcriptional regulator
MTGTSRQEEDLMVIETIRTRGESTRDEVAGELGVRSVFRTLVRLEADGRLCSRERYNAIGRRYDRVFRLNDAQLTVEARKAEPRNAEPTLAGAPT